LAGSTLGVVRPGRVAGFGGLATKPSAEGFSVWASNPSPRAWRDGDGIRVRWEALRRATRGLIQVLASGGREGLMDARPSNGELHVLTTMPL
jgi:hypothetical protein